jgi:hypothetical protein
MTPTVGLHFEGVPADIRLGWKSIAMKNTLAYYNVVMIRGYCKEY